MAAGLLLSACTGTATNPTGSTTPTDTTTQPATTPTKQLVIGSMIWDTSVPFYSNYIKGQQDMANQLGVTLKLVNGNNDIGTEVSMVQQLVSQGVDAIIVTPSDAQGIVPAIKQANAAGIPVFAANNRADDTQCDIVTFIGADDVEFGTQQAKLLAQALPNGGNVAYMMGQLGTSAQLLRKQGFDAEIANYPNIKIVESQSANWDAAQALSLTQVWLGKYPKGTLDAIVAQGPEAANAAKYASDNGRSDIKFIVGDYPIEVKQGIEAGYIYGTIDQDPGPQGQQSVQAAVNWLTGNQDKVTQPNMYLPLPIVTKDNEAQYPAAWGA